MKNRPRLENENGEMKMKSRHRCIRPSEERKERGREREIKGTTEFKCTTASNSVCLAADADISRCLLVLSITRWDIDLTHGDPA